MPDSLKKTFKKEERLTSKISIKELFNEGSSFSLYPFKILYVLKDEKREFPVNVVFTVPKRAFKRAVKRNYIRRRMKEAYRLHKAELNNQVVGKSFNVVFIYIAKDVNEYAFIEKKMKMVLERLGAIC